MARKTSPVYKNYANDEKMTQLFDYFANTSTYQHDDIFWRQNVRFIWLHNNSYEEKNEDIRRTIAKLRRLVNTVNTFTNTDRCVDFVTKITNGKIVMVIPSELSQDILDVAHDIALLDSIFICYGDKTKYEQWATKWPKIKGVFKGTSSLCETVKQVEQQCEQGEIPVSFVYTSGNASHQGPDQLDSLFMYTQILKEILLTINFKERQIQEFIDYCRQNFANDNYKLVCLEKFNRDYTSEKAIWWYTSEPFLYEVLNSALRTMDIGVLMKMSFYICDLYRHIEGEHGKQFGNPNSSQPFVVYRGQGLSKTDFDRLVETKGGLMAFNSFLSTSKDRAVSLAYAESNTDNANMIAILFVMTIDPSKSRTSFASAKEIGHYDEEAEILFSMHTVFRIGEVKQLDASKRLWQVNLTLTSDDDKDLRALTQRLSKETFPESDGWERLGLFLIKIGRPEKAEQVYKVSLKYTRNQHKRTVLKHQLGWANDCLGKDHEAIRCFEESIAAMERTRSADHPELASSYIGLGNVYNKRGEHRKALPYYEKALKIQQRNHRSNHSALAVTYNNIGAVYQNMKDYEKALSYYERALAIQEQNLPSFHPDLGVSYYNIGAAHHNVGNYSKALSFYEIARDIQRRALPSNHPDLIRVNDQIHSVQRKLQGRSSGAFNRPRNTWNSTVNYSSN